MTPNAQKKNAMHVVGTNMISASNERSMVTRKDERETVDQLWPPFK